MDRWSNAQMDRYIYCALSLQHVGAPLLNVVIVGQEVHAGSGRPGDALLVERIGDVAHAGLIAAAVADEDDVLEAVRSVAAADVRQERLERRLLETDRA